MRSAQLPQKHPIRYHARVWTSGKKMDHIKVVPMRHTTFSTSLSARLGCRLSRCLRHEKLENISTLYALTCRISPITCAQLRDIVACGSYGRTWLRNLQVVMLPNVCIMVLTVVGLPAVQGTAVERSAQQKQRRYRFDLPLPMRQRESTHDSARSF